MEGWGPRPLCLPWSNYLARKSKPSPKAWVGSKRLQVSVVQVVEIVKVDLSSGFAGFVQAVGRVTVPASQFSMETLYRPVQ